jgi:cysteinyl-tRNA synthetase, unknown class
MQRVIGLLRSSRTRPSKEPRLQMWLTLRRLWVVAALLAHLLLAISPDHATAASKQNAAALKRQSTLANVKTWGYQLQTFDMEQLKSSAYDLLVIDHAPDRVESVELLFRRAEIAPLKTKPDGTRRLVLAYLSIGEAERYRFYWNDEWCKSVARPTWLGSQNATWAGNYVVNFWRADWQKLIFGQSDSYVDRLLEAGFDGVYLDRADVYDEFKNRPTAKAEMVRFIAALSKHARSINPEAYVVLQNAEELVRQPDVRTSIDAIAKESLYFNAENGAEASAPDDEAEALSHLGLAKQAGRKILVVEYVQDPIKMALARQKAAEKDFPVYFAERTLSTLPDQIAPNANPAREAHRAAVVKPPTAETACR